MLSRAPPHMMLMVLLPLTSILNTQKLPINIVMIRASLCGKYTADASKSENDIGLLEANGGPISIMGYLLLWASLMQITLSLEVTPSI